MEVFLIVVCWFLSGAIGSFLLMEFSWRRGRIPLDVCMDDIVFFGFLTLAGLFTLVVGFWFFLGWAIKHAIGSPDYDGRRVILKARR